MNRRRLVLWGTMLLILAILGVAGVRIAQRLKPVGASPAPPLVVEVQRLGPRRFTLERNYVGTIMSQRRAWLAARISASVLAIHRREGEWVEAGELLITLDDRELVEEVGRLEAVSRRIRADLAFWRRQLSRDQKLLEQKLVATKQRDENRRMVETLEASLAENRHALANARTRLDDARLRAPFSGHVQQLAIETGELAAPGRRLVELVAPQPLRVVLQVPQQDLTLLQVGQKARFRQPLQSRQWQARIRRVYPAVDPRTRNATIEAPVAEELTGLLPGMAVEASVEVAVHEAAIVIPRHAVHRRRDGVGVFIVETGRARWRPVRTGAYQNGEVRILSGLSAGDRLIVTPDPRLEDGRPVREAGK